MVITSRIRHASQAKCTVTTAVCVCLSVYLSLAAFPHYCTDPDVTMGNARGAPSCALLGEFAIGALVSLLWQHTRKMRNVSEDLVLAVWLVFDYY